MDASPGSPFENNEPPGQRPNVNPANGTMKPAAEGSIQRAADSRAEHATPRGAGRASATVAGLALLTFAAQRVLLRRYVNDEMLSPIAPEFTDAIDYVIRARLVLNQSFDAGLGDAHRVPLYPLFLTAFLALFDEPLRWARWAQMALASICVPLMYGALRALDRPARQALAGAALAALYVPFYYYTPQLVAESLSIVGVFGLLFGMTVYPRYPGPVAAVGLGTMTAILTLLKPNHVLLAIPVLAFFLLEAQRQPATAAAASDRRAPSFPRPASVPAASDRRAPRFPPTATAPTASDRRAPPFPQSTLAFVAGLVLLVLPWSLYASIHNERFLPLSNTQPLNLYLGTGAQEHQLVGSGTVFNRVGMWLEIGDPEVQRCLPLGSSAEGQALLEAVAKQRWRDRPAALSLYGLAKAAHAFGLSFRSPLDAALAAVWAAAMAGAALLWRRPALRTWGRTLFVLMGVTALQAFVFLPNQRFRVVMFDPFALFVLSLALGELAERRQRSMPAPAKSDD